MTQITEFAQAPTEITFKLLVKAWEKLKKTRIDDLRRLAPNMTNLDKVYIRNIAEDEDTMTVEFVGIDTAALDMNRGSEVRRMIENWLQKISSSVQKFRNTNTSLTVQISKTLQVGHIDMTKSQPKKMNPSPKVESKYERTPSGVTKIIILRGH